MSNVTQDLRHHIWCEKYRPQVIDDCVLPERIKADAKSYVAQGKLPNLLFTGGAGVGKTTLARAMCNEVGADLLYLNASLTNSIDDVRTKISQFASTVSFTDAKKVTLLDEADGLTPQAQASLRALSENFSANHSFILTCNFKNKIIEPIHSRCSVIEFKIPSVEKSKLAAAMFKRVESILKLEGVEYDRKVVAELVQKYFPDFRRTLNELQRYAISGKIDSGILLDFTGDSFNELIGIIKAKKFESMRSWVASNSDMDSVTLFRAFYNHASQKLESKSIPALVLLLADYQFKASQVPDQELNTAAFLTELLTGNFVWK
jgi:DNA polymerase III delta prime subunit